jgi:hypothetical protein
VWRSGETARWRRLARSDGRARRNAVIEWSEEALLMKDRVHNQEAHAPCSEIVAESSAEDRLRASGKRVRVCRTVYARGCVEFQGRVRF